MAHHFIAADSCRYHMATWVAGGKYLVSTVGDYRPPSSPDAMQPIGAGAASFFETFVFECDPDDRGDDDGHPTVSDWSPCEGTRWSTYEQANDGHIRACVRWDAQP